MTRLYISIASIALTVLLGGCSTDGVPLLRSGGMADRVGNFATVRMGKRQSGQGDSAIETGAMTPLKRKLADGSVGQAESDEGYGFGTDETWGDGASLGDGEQGSGNRKHRHRHRHRNDGNPLFENSRTYEGQGQPYQGGQYQQQGSGSFQQGGQFQDDQSQQGQANNQAGGQAGSARFGESYYGEPRGYDRLKLPDGIPSGTTGNALDYSQALDAQSRQAQNVTITVTGNVFRLLPDDRRGNPHERFLIKLPNGTTVLIAHNINLAPYVPLAEGDLVTISGEFVWNPKGGVIHYTHRPTNVRHKGGYIDFNGKRYW